MSRRSISTIAKRSIQTRSGRISFMEKGAGPVALFVHGIVLNPQLVIDELTALSDLRHVISVELLGEGDTDIPPDQDVSAEANAKMLRHFLRALEIDQVDLVGNESGCDIAQIFAATHPECVRSLNRAG